MSHQPFETWILSEEPLEPSQAEPLQAHLVHCESCQKLQTNWRNVRSAMINDPSPLPAPGFTSRWHVRLAFERQKRQQRRMWILTLSILTLASLILIGLVLFNLTNISWSYLVSQMIANISVAIARIGHFWRIMGSLSTAFPIMIPLLAVFGMILISTASALILTWFSSMIRLFSPGKEGVAER